MRLTLRTLLAWLDGVLPSADQAELGEKIGASPIAPRLVDRIRDVMARPGLAAPRPDGRGLADDPNTVAEFLDNVLPAERLETFERVCIESDIHLAEAADCHAILAEMARDPAAIAPLDRRLRKRLVEQVARVAQQPAAFQPRSQRRAEAHEDAAATVAALKEAVAASRTAGRGVAVGPSATGRKASWAAWLSAGVAVLLLLGLVGLLARSLFMQPTKGREVAAARTDGAMPAPGVADSLATADRPASTEPPPGAEPMAGEKPDASDEGAAPAVAVEGAAPPPGPASDAAARPVAPAAADPTAVAALPARVVPEPPRPDPPPTVPLPQMELDGGEPLIPEPEPAPEAPAVAPGVLVEGGALLHRVGEGEEMEWKLLAPSDQLGEIEEFAVPAHAFPRVTRTRGELSIRLHPGTLAALVTDADGTPRLEVVFGRAVAWTEAAEAKLGITAGGLSGVVTLGPRQELGIEVALVREPGTDPAVVSPGRTALVHATGGVRWRQTEIDGGPPGQPLAGLEIEQALPPRSDLAWTSTAPATARITPVGRSPEWMRQQEAKDRLDQRAGKALAQRLAEGDAIEQTLRTMAEDGRPEDRMAAAATAALLGDYEPAVKILCEEAKGRRLYDGQWTGFEAATVQQALARGANAAARLREAFASQGPAGRGDELFLLARGLSPEELAGGGAGALVESLADPALGVRRYAFKNLLAAFPDDPAGRVEYMPDRRAGLNDEGITWWRRKVGETAAAPAP
ncbi:MAG: hypothetical protein ACKO1M_08165 [Planctomycetota bacterium]